MRFLKEKLFIILALFTFALMPVKAVFDNGWNSAGGGDFILDKNNPWYFFKRDSMIFDRYELPEKGVLYCVDHGGEALFSLPKAQTLFLIDKVFKDMTSQLERVLVIGPGSGDDSDELGINRFYQGACPFLDIHTYETYENYYGCSAGNESLGKTSKAFMNTRFEYTENCRKADLEIILGNTAHPKIKEMIKIKGEKDFRKSAGMAIRTEFDYSSMSGKGFIYLASDKGPLSYSGKRSSLLGENNIIWDLFSLIPPKTKLPLFFTGVNYYEELKTDLYFRDHMIGPFESVFAHELAHIFGVKHIEGGLMGEHFPAQVIARGFISKGEKNHLHDLFNNSLLDIKETPTSILIGRMADYHYNDWGALIKEKSPFIFENFLRDGNFYEDTLVAVPKHNFLKFEIQGNNGLIKVLKLDQSGLNYSLEDKYEVRLRESCSIPQVIGTIDFRSERSEIREELVINPITHQTEFSYENHKRVVSDVLVGIWNNQVCGDILVKGRVVDFSLKLNQNDSSILELRDPESGEVYREVVQPLDVSPLGTEPIKPLIFDYPIIDFLGIPA